MSTPISFLFPLIPHTSNLMIAKPYTTVNIKRVKMTQKNQTQLIDKTTRNRIFNSRYWKEECFALTGVTLIDKAVKIKSIGMLYGGAKKPTKFLCLVMKMLQMNVQRDIWELYLGERDYKYLTAMTLVYLRLTLKAPEVYQLLEPFYADNRKLRLRTSIGGYELTYMDKLVQQLLGQEICMGLALPYVQRRLALQLQQVLQPRMSLIQEELNAAREHPLILKQQIRQQPQEDQV